MRSVATFFSVILVLSIVAFSTPQMASAQDPAAAPLPVRLDVAQGSTPRSLFEPPEGLTKDARLLLWELGYLASPDSVLVSPFTYRFCLDVAVKCHVQRRYVDSLAFARRAAKISETSSVLYLKGLNELALGLGAESVATVGRLKSPESVKTDFNWLREKMSSPLTGRMEMLLEVL